MQAKGLNLKANTLIDIIGGYYRFHNLAEVPLSHLTPYNALQITAQPIVNSRSNSAVTMPSVSTIPPVVAANVSSAASSLPSYSNPTAISNSSSGTHFSPMLPVTAKTTQTMSSSNAAMMPSSSSISIAQKRPASPTTDEPVTKRLAKAPKKREYERQALRQCYEEPELWFAPDRLSFQQICQLLWNNATIFEEGKLEAALDSIVNDPPATLGYQTIIYLFYMHCELGQKNEEDLRGKIKQVIITLLPTLEPFEQGQLIRYASLIHTDNPSFADGFRYEIVKSLMTSISVENHKVWISTQEKIEKTWEFCDRLYKDPDQIKGITQLQIPDMNGVEEIKQVALQLKKRCEEWLILLSKGKEVRLPAFYHGIGTKHKTAKVVPHSFLNGKIIAQNEGGTGNFAGAYVSTRLEDVDDPAYFAPGVAFPLWSLFRYPHDILNFNLPNTVSQKYAATRRLKDRWIGVHNGIPISLEESGNDVLMGHNLAIVIADDENSVEQQHKELPKALSDVSVMSRREAKVLEYALRQSAPVLVPAYRSVTTQVNSLHFANPSNESVKLRSTFHLTLKGCCWGNDKGIRQANADIQKAHQLKKTNAIPLLNLLVKLVKNSDEMQKLICDGYFTMGAQEPALHTERNEGSEILMKTVFASRKERLGEIEKVFPFIKSYPVEPLHHVWPWGTHEDFGKVVGYNPYLILNSAAINKVIFEYAVGVRKELQALEPFADLMDKILIEGDATMRSTLMTYIIYKMIIQARTCEAFSGGIGIFVPLPKDDGGSPSEIFLDQDSFDVMEAHGRDERQNPNDPWLTLKLYLDLTPVEKEALHCRVLSQQSPEINEQQAKRVYIVKGLMEEMGSAMDKRYFNANKLREALPNSASNTLLVKFLQDIPTEEIIEKEKQLMNVWIPKKSELDQFRQISLCNAYGGQNNMRKAVRTGKSINTLLKSVSKNDKALWQNAALLNEKAATLSFKDIDKSFPASPLHVLLLSCMRAKRSKSTRPIDISQCKELKKRCRSMLQLLSKVGEGRLRKALPLIDGDIGRQLRHVLYPMLYKDSKKHTCYEQSIGELLAEGKALAEKALQDSTGKDMELCGLSHLTPECQKKIMQEWLGFIVERQQKIAKGQDVSLTQWGASTLAELGRVVLYPSIDSNMPVGTYEMGLPNVLEAERSIVENKDQKSFDVKYFCGVEGQKLPASCLTFFANDDAVASSEGLEKWFFGDISQVRRLSQEAALLERRFLIGRRPDMISLSWKHVEASSCEKLHIPRLTE